MKKFHYVNNIHGSEPAVLKFIAVTGTTFAAGDLLALAGGQVQKAAAGATAIVGVAIEGVTNAVANVEVQVEIAPGSVYRTGYEGVTKTTLSKTDIGTAFDLNATADGINLDDTTGGFAVIVGFNTTDQTADVLIKNRVFVQ